MLTSHYRPAGSPSRRVGQELLLLPGPGNAPRGPHCSRPSPRPPSGARAPLPCCCIAAVLLSTGTGVRHDNLYIRQKHQHTHASAREPLTPKSVRRLLNPPPTRPPRTLCALDDRLAASTRSLRVFSPDGYRLRAPEARLRMHHGSRSRPWGLGQEVLRRRGSGQPQHILWGHETEWSTFEVGHRASRGQAGCGKSGHRVDRQRQLPDFPTLSEPDTLWCPPSRA